LHVCRQRALIARAQLAGSAVVSKERIPALFNLQCRALEGVPVVPAPQALTMHQQVRATALQAQHPIQYVAAGRGIIFVQKQAELLEGRVPVRPGPKRIPLVVGALVI